MNLNIENGLITRAQRSEHSRLSIDGRDLPLPDNGTILPGFVDAHCHLIGPGQMAERLDLRGTASLWDCLKIVERAAAERPPGSWIFGFGWNQESWAERDRVHRKSLDAVAPDHPVALYRVDTHALWCNSTAIAAAGIDAGSRVDGGEVEVNRVGEVTGILIDKAIGLIERMIPRATSDDVARWYRYGVEHCLRYGITEVHDMTVAPEWLDAMTSLGESGEMRLRCRMFLDGADDRWRAVPRPGSLAPNVEAVGVKYFSDGALGSRGAWLLEPYADAPSTKGLALLTSDELFERAAAAIDAGYAIATHAIGDAANHEVLDAYERLRQDHPEAILRIEHAQIVHPLDVPRFAAHHILASVQPVHCTSDARMAERRLGADRVAYAYGWRALRDLHVPLLGGSDFPIESADPLLGLRAFVDRADDRGPWHPEQAITRDEAIRAYTEWPRLGYAEHFVRGGLDVGSDADVVVLGGDPFDENTEVIMTIVGGRVEYARE